MFDIIIIYFFFNYGILSVFLFFEEKFMEKYICIVFLFDIFNLLCIMVFIDIFYFGEYIELINLCVCIKRLVFRVKI